jgi:hypothetical protein
MRRHPPAAIAGPAIVAMAMAQPGCGDDPQLEQGTFPFRSSNTASVGPLRDEMIKVMRDRSYLKTSAGDVRPAARSDPMAGSTPGPKP